MKRVVLSFIFSALIGFVQAQDEQVAQVNYRTILQMQLPQDPNHLQQEVWRKNFDNYMKKLKEEIGIYSTGATDARHQSSIDRIDAYNKLSSCLQSFSNVDGSFLPRMKTFIDECDRTYRELTVSHQDALNQLGNNMPSDFLNRVTRERDLVKKMQENHAHPDEAVVVDDFTTMSQTEYLLDDPNNVLTPVNAKLAQDVVSILVNLYQNDGVENVVATQEDNDVMLEVVKLGQMVSAINLDPERCRVSLDENLETEESILAQSILVDGHVVHEHEAKPAITAFFGLSPQQLNKIQAYRFNEGDRETWLFRDGRGGLEEIWVMAELDPETKAISYRHFIIREAKQESLIARETLNFLPQFAGGVARNQNHTLFETDVGIKLEVDSQAVPLLGMVPVPNGRVVLGSARLRTFGAQNGTDTRVDVDLERVTLSSGLYRNNNNWNVSAVTYYKTFENKWHAGVQGRVYNLFGGYATNSNKDYEYHVGLVVKQNYAKVQINQNQTTLSVGRQFRNNRGGAAINTNFKDQTQFRIYIFL